MNRNTFCTIITFDYLPYVLALNDSICKFNVANLSVLISDKTFLDLCDEEQRSIEALPENITLYYYDQLSENALSREIFEKYWRADMDCYRWSTKGVFIKYLLENKNFNKVIYTDCDLFFFNDYAFLFDELDDFNILLTPHWRSSDPERDIKNFDHLFVGGLFNAGFVGVNKDGVSAMDWWQKVCLYKCEKDFSNGYYVDQTYLNLFPLLFDKVQILKHKGCNVANWNQIDCPRSLEDGQIRIDKKWPVIFIHFTNSTIYGIQYKKDKFLAPLLEIYAETLNKFGIKLPERTKDKKKATSYMKFLKAKVRRALN